MCLNGEQALPLDADLCGHCSPVYGILDFYVLDPIGRLLQRKWKTECALQHLCSPAQSSPLLSNGVLQHADAAGTHGRWKLWPGMDPLLLAPLTHKQAQLTT